MEIVTTEFFESIDPQLRDEVDGRNRHVWDHFSDGTTTYHVRMPLQYLREASNQAQHNEGHVTLPLPQLELEQHTQYHYPDPELSGICGTELSGSLASSSALQHGGDPEFSASPYNNEHAMQPQPGNVPMSPATRRSQYPEFAANDLSYEYGARTRKGTLPPFSTIAGFDQDTNRYHNEAYYPHEANLFGRPANGSLPPFSAIASSGQDTNGHANEVAYPTPTSLSAPQTQSINNTPGGRASRRAAGVLDTARNALAAAHDMLKPIFTSNTNVQFSLGWMEDNNIDDTLLDGMSYDHVFMHWETLCRYGVLLPGDTLRVTFYPLDSGSAPTDVDAQVRNCRDTSDSVILI